MIGENGGGTAHPDDVVPVDEIGLPEPEEHAEEADESTTLGNQGWMARTFWPPPNRPPRKKKAGW